MGSLCPERLGLRAPPPPRWSLQGALPIKVGMDVWEMLHPKMSGRPVKAGESLSREACFSWNLLVLAGCLMFGPSYSPAEHVLGNAPHVVKLAI